MYTTKLNNTTKRAIGFIDSYNRAINRKNYSVENFYSRPSYNKIRAENECINKMKSINGYGYRVLGGNSSFFTCGYKSENGDILYIETACNTYEIAL